MLPRARSTPPAWILIFGAWLIPALLAAFNSLVQDGLEGRPTDWRWVLFNFFDWLAYALLTPLVFRASRRYPLERPYASKNIGVHVIGALLMCAAWALLGTVLRLAIFHPGKAAMPQGPLLWFASWISTTLPFGFGVYFALVGIQHATAYLAKAREREAQAARLAAQLSEARLGALRMQLHPHFLFNSLNAITVLVRDGNADAASRMLELLSEILRQVLRTEAGHETALSDELEFLERYLAIEQVRFSDRLQVRFDVPSELSRAAVPRFLLQPLVENALRHGVGRLAGAGLLEISAERDGDRLVITLRDNGPGLPLPAKPVTGVGLANTRARLFELYAEAGSLDVANASGGGVIAVVRLPYHEVEKNA
jgi:two-component system, LytTR family, sensor kinase